MRRRSSLAVLALPALLLTAALPPTLRARAEQGAAVLQRSTTSEEDRFAALAAAFYDEYLQRFPTDSTTFGAHRYDHAVEDLSPAGLDARADWLRGWEARLKAIDPAGLSRRSAQDLRLLQHGLGRRLFSVSGLRDHHRRPMIYLGLATSTVYALIKRDFAPLKDRLAAVLSREAQIPAILRAGQANLDQVPRASLDLALDQLPGIVAFFREDVPRAFADLPKDQLAALSDRTQTVVDAIAAFERHLRTQVAPKALPSFALGDDLFRRKLHWDLWIDEPLPELLARGEAELKRLQAEFRATAARIDPKRPPAQVQLDLQKNHPAADQVIPETQARLQAIRDFITARGLLTLPSPLLPQVRETPPFLRATTLAAMDTPGPFEPKALEAYYYVTLPEPSWTHAQAEDFLRGAFNRPLIDVVSIHEALPGHYVQFLWRPQATKIRKFEESNVTSEGWAHYVEQMMLEEGYGEGDPRLKLMQVQDALLRAARFVAAIRMHAPPKGTALTQAQAADFFVRDGLQTRKVAELEARRGTQEPTFLSYTYGKLEVLRLREDHKALQQRQGAPFTLRRFHDAFLSEGNIPMPLMREALLGPAADPPPPPAAPKT